MFHYPRIVWLFAALLSLFWASTSTSETGRKQAYQIAVGLAVLESEAPRDGFGQSEYVVTVRRHDPAVAGELQKVVARQKALDRDLKKLERRIREEEGRGTEEATAKDVAGREDFLTSSNERRESIRRQVDTVRSTAKALRRLLSGRSPQVTVSGPRVHFADVKLPVKVYEGDRVTISLIEEDAFGHDLMGRKTIVLDQRVLDRGRLELSTGWVELLHLQLVRVE